MIELDLNGALNNLGGSLKLYRMLATGFISKYSLIDQEISDRLLNYELEEARRLVHSMKGLAGNLGTIEFVNASKVLETDIMKFHLESVSDKQIQDVIQTSWLEFSMSLKRVIDTLNELLCLKDEQILDI